MDTFSVIISILVIIACWATAVADFTRAPQIVETMQRLGVALRLMPVLGAAKVLGGLGLIVGQWNDAALIFSATCLAVYFGAAIVIHFRAKDSVSGTAPAALLFVLSAFLVIVTL